MRESALTVLVPEADALVERWREDYDPSAAVGVPAHITVLYPFLDPERIDDQVVDDVRDLLAGFAPIEYRLSRIATFPNVVYLEPEPDEPFRQLTAAVAERWPDHPPYGGEFEDVIPHLTVAQPDDETRTRALATEVAVAFDGALPLELRAEAVVLLVEGEDGFWRPHTKLPLGG